MNLTFQPNIKQHQAVLKWADSTTEEIVFGGAKYGGKSFLGCALIFADALTYPDTDYFIAREELNDLRKHTVRSIDMVFKNWGIKQDGYCRYNGQDNFYQLYNGSRVYFLEAKFNPRDPLFERFGSTQFTRGWIEEAGEIHALAKDNLLAAIGRKNNDKYNLKKKLLITCNPKKNWLYDDFYLPAKTGTLPANRAFVQAYATDNTHGDKDYIDSLSRMSDQLMHERLFLGNWEYADDADAMVTYDAVNDMFVNENVPQGTKRISADLAMQGRDRFVAGAWSGNVCTIRIDKEKSSGKDIETDLRDLMAAEQVPNSKVVADSDGLGSYLESYIKNIKQFHGGASAFKKQEYNNLKSECAFKLAELINQRQIRVICTDAQREAIKKELKYLKRKDPDGDEKRKRIISKEEIKASLRHSPDYLDMLIMGMYHLVAPAGGYSGWGS